jgi:hypothetical protein
MKLKTVEREGVTYAEVLDGKPVYTGDDGKDIAFDATATVATISRITEESKGFKTRAQSAEEKLGKFEGIDDAEAAKRALATVSNLDQKKLIDAGEVEKVKAEAIKAIEDKYKPIVEERDRLQGDLYSEKIGGAFSRSKFITDKVAVPADMVQAAFGKAFKIEDGKTVAYGPDGNKIYSRSKPGEPADFEEALEHLVEAYPHKDSILKGTGHQGSGALPGGAQLGGADLSKLSPVDRINAVRAATTR